MVDPLPWGSVAERAFGVVTCSMCDGSGTTLVIGVRLPCACRPFEPASVTRAVTW